MRQASSSTVGTLIYTVQLACRESSSNTSLSRTTIGPFVITPAGVRALASASSNRRVIL
jgi:hypothetical protein